MRIDQLIKDNENGFEIKKPRVPRKRPFRKFGEATSHNFNPPDVKSCHRINSYNTSIDRVVTELIHRFNEQDQEVLCSIGHLIYDKQPNDTSSDTVSKYYGLEKHFSRWTKIC